MSLQRADPARLLVEQIGDIVEIMGRFLEKETAIERLVAIPTAEIDTAVRDIVIRDHMFGRADFVVVDQLFYLLHNRAEAQGEGDDRGRGIVVKGRF